MTSGTCRRWNDERRRSKLQRVNEPELRLGGPLGPRANARPPTTRDGWRPPRRWVGVAGWALVALLGTPVAAAAPGPAEPTDGFQSDERGRRFRVSFDPGNEARLGVALQRIDGPDDEAAWAPAITTGVALRSESAEGVGDEAVQWHVEHQLLTGRVTPPGAAIAGDAGWAFEALAYRGTYLRHTEAPYMVLPSNPPRRLFFPFDLGLETDLLRVARRAGAALPAGSSERLEIGVASAGLLLDPWRTGVSGRRLELGIGARYRVDLEPPPGQGSPQRVVHRVAPFTATSLRLLVEAWGRARLRLDADCVPHWSSHGGWSLDTEASAAWEQVFVAFNDEPLWTVVRVSHRRRPPGPASTAGEELTVSVGVSLGWQLQ